MIEEQWMYVVFAVTTIVLLVRARRTTDSVAQITFQVLLVFYASRVIALTFLPFPIKGDFLAAERETFAMGIGQTNNFVPFETIRDTWGWTFNRQILGNLIMLFPLGVLTPLALRKFRSARSLITLVVGAAVGIETLQLLLSQALGYNYKSFDVDDLWLNALGGLTGAIFGLLIVRHKMYARLTHAEVGGVSQVGPSMHTRDLHVPH